MSIKCRLYLGRKILESLHNSPKYSAFDLQNLIQIGKVQPDNNMEMYLPLTQLENHLGIRNITEILKIHPDEIIKDIASIKNTTIKKISFKIDRRIFIKDILENGHQPDINLKPSAIVVEYSSPNIAKPFHMGHLRSTIIGNFISNLHTFLNNNVTRLNYLGDWGTQFGLVKVGVDELKYSSETIKDNPLKLLYKSYVHANKLAESDPKILIKAREEFTKLEEGLPPGEDNYWENYVAYSKVELENTYKRLGITFDEYNYESMYKKKEINNILDILTQNRILQVDSDGKKVALIDDRRILVIKSDGSSLYLTRDIAAAVDRFNKYKFDKMYYVVDNSQTEHFNTLKNILHRMNFVWSDRLRHIKFGRIRGMSTRKGTAVFLNDILDESRDIMMKKQLESPTTKVSITNGDISDILGISCVIINDLKQRRQKDYEFTWDKVLQTQGDTGIKLQYTHCRLCSLEQNSGAIPALTCIPEILNQTEATSLIINLAKFHEVLYKTNEQLEACILVTYLFHLCNHINKALKVLHVKGSEPDVASQRLLLFQSAKKVLYTGMTILGLKPLQAM